MEKLRMKTESIVDSNIEYIASKFPNCVVETLDENGQGTKRVDFDLLKQELSKELIDENKERYQMTWPNKKQAVLKANTEIAKTLRPCREESEDYENTENIYIEGDNLDVLKVLRQTYMHKVKMIYIDPPYNTGNDFIYKDNYSKDREEYLEESGQVDEDGNRMCKNPESNGRFHTDWLNMIYPRLRVAKDLLTDDGVIFISIDDNEVHNLRKVCDEIFGESNFMGELPRVTKRGGKSTEYIAKNHDYLLVFAKNIQNIKLYPPKHLDKNFCYKDKYFNERGAYKLNQTLDYNSLQYNKSMDYVIEYEGKKYFAGGSENDYNNRKLGQHNNHDWVWRWSTRIYTKTYQNEKKKKINNEYKVVIVDRTKALSSIEFTNNEYSNDNAKKAINQIFDAEYFEYTKPLRIMRFLVEFSTKSNDIILDFFSGSGTTAHAVMQLNAEDNGNRKFIMVQLPEKCDEKSEAYKAGYKNICEIGKERIRRAGKKIKEENANATNIDTGFRVFKLDSSNMKDCYYYPEDTTQDMLEKLQDNIKEDRTAEDLLIQVMLELEVELSSKIETVEIEGKKVYKVNEKELVCCFERNLTNAIVTEIAKMQPKYAVFRDSSMQSDSVNINFEQLFKSYAPNTIRKVL